MTRIPVGSTRLRMRVGVVRAAAAAAAISAVFAAAAAAQTAPGNVHASHHDGYVLSTEGRWISSGVDFDELSRARGRRSGDFLWFHRSGKSYLVEDPATLDRAAKLFDPLRALEPEQDALRDKERALDDRENAFDAEEERIEAAMERWEGEDEGDSDDESEDVDSRPLAQLSAEDERERDELARQLDELHAKQRELHAEQRAYDREERELDAREERIERDAESKLWQLLDETVGNGTAKPAPGTIAE